MSHSALGWVLIWIGLLLTVSGVGLLRGERAKGHSVYKPEDAYLLELARVSLADIAYSKDMTFDIARKKADRIYRAIKAEFPISTETPR